MRITLVDLVNKHEYLGSPVKSCSKNCTLYRYQYGHKFQTYKHIGMGDDFYLQGKVPVLTPLEDVIKEFHNYGTRKPAKCVICDGAGCDLCEFTGKI